jgi:hypothetical protein
MWLLASAYVHLVAGVLLTGYALFWAILALSLGRQSEDAAVRRLLGLANSARWPHVGVPAALRLRWPAVGWIFLLVTALTGVLLLAGAAFSVILAVKLVLFLVLLGSQLMLTLRPAPAVACLNCAVVVLIIAASALLRH